MKYIPLSRSLNQGFTIVEILLVIVILVILATLTVANFKGASTRGVNTQLVDDTRKAADQLELDYSDNGSYPADAASVNKNAGFQKSAGTNFTYVPAADLKSFCLQASSTRPGTKVYKVVQDSKVVEGTC